jgi:hypothetical protein
MKSRDDSEKNEKFPHSMTVVVRIDDQSRPLSAISRNHSTCTLRSEQIPDAVLKGNAWVGTEPGASECLSSSLPDVSHSEMALGAVSEEQSIA